ncbi:MAG: hypothetical protein MJ252_22020 [archaeon]|nr:hypothetical protein [archaeon]
MSSKTNNLFGLIFLSFILSFTLINYQNYKRKNNFTHSNEDFTPFNKNNFYLRDLSVSVDVEAYDKMCYEGGKKFTKLRENPNKSYKTSKNKNAQKLIDLFEGEVKADSDEFRTYVKRVVVVIVFGCFAGLAVIIWIIYCFFCCCDSFCNCGCCKSKGCSPGFGGMMSIISFFLIAVFCFVVILVSL